MHLKMHTFGKVLAVLSVVALVAAEVYFEEKFLDGECYAVEYILGFRFSAGAPSRSAANL